MPDYGIIVQARTGSTRRPRKVCHEILGHPLLHHQLQRLLRSRVADVFVATTTDPSDDAIEAICLKAGVQAFRGPIDDVMARYIMAAQQFGVHNIVRVGGDDPLIDPECIASLIQHHRDSPADLIYASHRKGWIYGTAAELVQLDALERASRIAHNANDREHVVSFLRDNSQFRQYRICPTDSTLVRPDILLSVDYEEDLVLIAEILRFFDLKGRLYGFSQGDLVTLFDSGILKIKNTHLHDGFPD